MSSLVTLSGKLLETHRLSADFVVIGGGMSGICASLAAARNGASVVLVQDRSVLGGNASSEIKMHIVGADVHNLRPGARESGLIEELRLEDAARNPHRSYPQWDLYLYEKVKAEPLITLLLDSTCVSCTTDPETGAIREVTVLRNSTDDVFVISGTFFADCSGDSRLAAEAGADYHVGREGKSTYGESLARETGDSQTLGSSILITARRYDTPQPFLPPDWVRPFTKGDLNHRPIHSYEYGYWWFEWGGQLNSIKDNEVIRHELLRIALGIWNYVKNSGDHPDSENWALEWVGAIPGKRESRRLIGQHVLTQSDVQGGTLFPDMVAYGGWAIDLHPPSGVDAKDEPPFTPTHVENLYTIPFRTYCSRNIPNLLCAGRNISASHVAFASTRVMATCAIGGQAVGTAVALAVRGGLPISAFGEGKPLRDLQQTLMKDDAYLPTLLNEDPGDLALRGTFSASSSLPDRGPELVIDGITRDLTFPRLGTWSDNKPHHWESESLPAWIEVALPTESLVSEVHLTFDTGFQRELVLTPSDYVTGKTVRGCQPETVRDYRITADGKVIAEIKGNFFRKRVHKLAEPVPASSIRVEILTTNGVETARVFEIRVY